MTGTIAHWPDGRAIPVIDFLQIVWISIAEEEAKDLVSAPKLPKCGARSYTGASQ
jgi:hypothetical protein